jgi:outer membrane receptor protein involved in Fe transport
VWSLSAAVLGLVWMASVGAQQTLSTGGEQSNDKLEEIVVTAAKRSATVLETPISITAISGADIQARGPTDFASLLETVPGVSTFEQGPGQTQITIRGVDGTAGNSPTVGFYLGDTPLTAPAGANDGKVVIDPALYDLNRVEVLRGPQGTLYGASSMGGTVRLIPNDPDPTAFDFSAQGIASGTDGGSANGTANAMVNIPMLDGKAALRLVGTQQHTSGWISEIVLAPGTFPPDGINNNGSTRGNVSAAPVAVDHKGANAEGLTAARATLLVNPTDSLTITPMVFYQQIKLGMPDVIDSVPGKLAVYQPYDVPQPYSDKVLLESLNIDYKAPWFDVVSNTSYWNRTSTNTRADAEPISVAFGAPSAYAFGPIVFTATDTSHQFSQEVRLSSQGHTRFTWIVGGYYSNFGSVGYNVGGGNGLIPTFGYANLFTKIIPISISQTAGFGEVSYEILSGLRATFGAREFSYTTKQVDYEDGIVRGTNQIQTVVVSPGSSSGLNPKFDISYHPNDDLTIYTTAAKGFRPGGGNQLPPTAGPSVAACNADLNALGLSAEPTGYKPDSLWSYELGEKARFLGGRVSLNADVYLEKWMKLQQLVSLSGSCGVDFTTNAGAARIPGGELELSAIVIDGLQANVGVGYSHGRISQGSVAGATVVGTRIQDVPDVTYNVSLAYTRSLANQLVLISRIENSYVGSRYEPDKLGGSPTLSSYDLTNARVGVQMEHWQASLFANNVFNKHAEIGIANNEALNIPAFLGLVSNQPLTVGVDVSYRFH